MNRCCFVYVALIVLTATSAAQDKPKEAKTFLSVLKVGQAVAVKDSAGRYEITLMEGQRGDIRLAGYKVAEVGADYVVVEDISGVTELRIPVYSIKSIVRLHLDGRR